MAKNRCEDGRTLRCSGHGGDMTSERKPAPTRGRGGLVVSCRMRASQSRPRSVRRHQATVRCRRERTPATNRTPDPSEGSALAELVERLEAAGYSTEIRFHDDAIT